MAEVSSIKLRIEGMDCGACALKIENAMKRLPGVADLSVSYTQAMLSLALDEDRTSRETVAARIRALGFTPIVFDDRVPSSASLGRGAGARGRWWKTAKGRLTIGIGVLLLMAYLVGLIAPAWSL